MFYRLFITSLFLTQSFLFAENIGASNDLQTIENSLETTQMPDVLNSEIAAQNLRKNANQSSAGFGLKTSSGSGTWEHQRSGESLSTGNIDTGITLFSLYALDGAFEFAFGPGSFTYEDGHTRDFVDMEFLFNIGRGTYKNGLSPYLSLGLSWMFVNYSDLAKSGSDVTAFEMNGLLGAGLAFRFQDVELFIDYTISQSLASTGYMNTSGYYIETYHDTNRLALGVALYF